MNKGVHVASLILILALIPLRAGAVTGERIPVVPYPQQVEMGEGALAISGPSLTLRISGIQGNSESDHPRTALGCFFDQVWNGTGPVRKKGTGYVDRPAGSDDQLMEVARKKGIVPGTDLGRKATS